MKITIAVLLASLLTGCGYMKGLDSGVAGSGVAKTEKRSVSAFKSIKASGAFDIEIVCQKEPSLEVEGDDNLLPLVKTEVRGDTLYIEPEKNYSSRKGMRVRITVQNLDGISSSGASSFQVTELNNDKLSVDTSGASNINLSGKTKSLDLDMSGASKADTEQLRAERVKVSLSGAGKANVYASEELTAKVSGAGSVTYAGDPKQVHPQVSGVGSVTKKQS